MILGTCAAVPFSCMENHGGLFEANDDLTAASPPSDADDEDRLEGITASPATFLEVLAEAPPGSTIELGAGIYRLPSTLHIGNHVLLVGAGMNRTRIESTGSGPVLRLAQSAALAIRDLTVALNSPDPGNAIEASDGALIMDRVRVTGARGGRATPSGAHSPTSGNVEPGYGLVLDGSVWATLSACLFETNEAGGICVRGSCAPTIANIQAEGGTVGVVFAGQSAGALTRSRCVGSAIGVLVLDRARPVLEANICRGNTHTGIAYRMLASGLARANDCSDNGSAGIWVGDAATPTLDGNHCRSNRTAGIVYRRAAGGSATNNFCTGGTVAGIWIGEGACPDLIGNRCESNANGLSFTEYGAGSARDNSCTSNTLFGISVAAHASPVIEANDLSSNILGEIVDQRMPDYGMYILPN